MPLYMTDLFSRRGINTTVYETTLLTVANDVDEAIKRFHNHIDEIINGLSEEGLMGGMLPEDFRLGNINIVLVDLNEVAEIIVDKR